MIHYHGTPIACSDDQAARILKGRHAFVSYGSRNSVYQLPIIEEVCQSYALDNGAFSLFKSGNPVDWDGYYKFLDEVYGPRRTSQLFRTRLEDQRKIKIVSSRNGLLKIQRSKGFRFGIQTNQ